MSLREVRSPVLALALVALLVGCGDGDDNEASPGTTATTATTTSTTATAPSTTSRPTTTAGGQEVSLTQSCFLVEENLEVEVPFPEGWVANERTEAQNGQVVPACRVFHHEPFELPRANELTGFDVFFGVDNVAFDTVANANGPMNEVLEEERLQVAGRDALRREIRTTEDGIAGPAGTRVTLYYVDLSGQRVLVARTHDVGALDYERNQQVLEAMVEEVSVTLGEG